MVFAEPGCNHEGMAHSLPSPRAVILRVLLADDHAPYRLRLQSLLDGESDMQVVAEAANGVEAMQQTQQLIASVLPEVSARWPRK